MRPSLRMTAAMVSGVAFGAERPNLVFIAMDDLRLAGESFGAPEVKMPNLDRLASRSTIFTKAYSQAPTCGVSRSSLLTGRRPDTTFVVKRNGDCPFTSAPSHEDWQSLPQYFKNHEYVTAGIGKIYHPDICEGAEVGEQSAAWSLPYYHAPCISLGSMYNGTCYEDYPGPVPCGEPCKKITSVYANATATDDDMPDGMIARNSIDKMRELATNSSQPFFLAVGFHKPHLPHIAPKKYFDMYPLDEVSLPANPYPPQNSPLFAWSRSGEWRTYSDVAEVCAVANFSRETPVGELEMRIQRQAYFAAASYGDAQVGRVLDELDNLGIANETIVVLFGDHGWHLGENNEWGKHTAMKQASHAPLLFSVPGAAARVSDNFVEFVDIYPTVADLAGLPVPSLCETEDMSQNAAVCTEGSSLKSMIVPELGEEVPVKDFAFGQWWLNKHMSYSLFTRLGDGTEVRYTEWVAYNDTEHKPNWDKVEGRELYNHTADPGEDLSIHDTQELSAVVEKLSSALHAGWRQYPGLRSSTFEV